MRILAFQARRFWWRSFSKTLEEAADSKAQVGDEDEATDAIVAWLHIEAGDAAGGDARRARVFRHTLKHVKWLANKRGFTNVVLHSFTHLGGDNADPAFARSFLQELAGRLTATGYAVKLTPFGYFCEWELSVHGESLAKVWKEI